MESSDYTARTVDIVTRVHKEFPNTGTVLQSYLHRNDDDVQHVIDNKMRGIFAGPALTRRSQDYRSKDWPIEIRSLHHRLVVRTRESLQVLVVVDLREHGGPCL